MTKHNKTIFIGILLTALFLVSAAVGPIHFAAALPGPEDAYEDNDTLATAAPIAPNNVYNLTAGDEDYYSFAAKANDEINVSLTYDSLSQVMALELYDSNGTLLSSSNAGTGFEFISYNISYADTVIIRVYTPSDTYVNETYLLDIRLTAPKIDDTFEENDDTASAPQIEPGFYPNLYQWDLDYYAIALNASDELYVGASYNTTLDNLTLGIYDSSITLVASGTFNVTLGGMSVTYNASVAGTYYIEVSGSAIGLLYALDIIVTAPAGAVADDLYEENDDAASAPKITPNLYPDLVQWDADYFAIDFTAGDEVYIALSYNTTIGNLTLDLLDVSVAVIASGYYNSTVPGMSLYYNVTTTGTYYIYVDGPALGQIYSLDIMVTSSGSAPAPSDDSFEENDNATSPAFIADGYYTDLVLLDPDYYDIYLGYNDKAVITIEYNSSLFSLTAYLITPSGDVFAFNDDPVAGIQTIEYNATTYYGDYLICVNNSYYGAFYYNLNFTLYIGLHDDVFEDNDMDTSATSLLPNDNISDLILIDNDWFKVYWDGSFDTIIVNVSFYVDASQYAHIDILDNNLNVIASANLISPTFFSAKAYLPGYVGDIYIDVYPVEQAREMYYNITVQSIAGGSDNNQCPVDDVFEENDQIEFSVNLNPGRYDNLILCDVDFYEVNVEANTSLTFIITFDSTANLRFELWMKYTDGSVVPIKPTSVTTDPGKISIVVSVNATGKVILSLTPDNQFIGLPYALDIISNPNNVTGSTDNNTSTSTETDNNGDVNNPFEAIPGYPVEVLMPIIAISVIFIMRKKFRA